MYRRKLIRCYRKIEGWLDDSQMAELLSCGEAELCRYHLGFGTAIRNQILGQDREIVRLLSSRGYKDRDEMSMAVIRGFYHYEKMMSL